MNQCSRLNTVSDSRAPTEFTIPRSVDAAPETEATLDIRVQ
jgi:hypothetical protein